MAEKIQTRQQQRARAVYGKVFAVQPESWAPQYGRQCRRLPFLIIECGLCQALAFLEAKGGGPKGKQEFRRLLDDLAVVTGHTAGGAKYAKAVREAPVQEYRHMSRTALACANWFKRYAEALGLGDEESES